MACSAGCPTPGSHRSWGECVRSKRSSVMGLESTAGDFTSNQRMHRENTAYRDAVAEGLQPQAPTFAAIDRAKKAADTAGKPVATR